MLGKRYRNVWAGAVLVAVLAPTGAEAKVPRNVAGKVFFSIDRIVDQEQSALVRLFAKRKPKIELIRPKRSKSGKSSLWKTTLVAFFRKPSVHGPMTVWLYDKADRASIKAKEPVHVMSVDAKGPTEVFVYELGINPDLGFNRKHTYIIYVGQIIGKRSKYYAKGEVSLK
jgi:hypothetical protein